MSSKLPPGPTKSPRTTMKWLRHPDAVMRDAHERYGDIWMLRMQKQTTFVLGSDPELIKAVLTADEDVLRGGEANAMIGTALLGPNSVILLDGREHMIQRNLLLPLFHAERVQRYPRSCSERASRSSRAGRWASRFPLLPGMQAITLHAIMSAVFGVADGTGHESLRARIRACSIFRRASAEWR